MKRFFVAVVSIVFCLIGSLSLANANLMKELELGQKIYTGACKACHAPAMATALKSPAEHDVAAWKARFAMAAKASKADPKKYPTPISFLVSKVRNGFKAMPPGGNCINQATADKKCTDAQYEAAIKFMSSAKKK